MSNCAVPSLYQGSNVVRFPNRGLGDYASTSHAIPYALSAPEIQQFLKRHAGEPELSKYLWSKDPEWGILVNESYGQYSAWFDASGVFHVTDVTNMNIAKQIQNAPYVSPDSSLISDLMDQMNDLIRNANKGLNLGLEYGPLLAIGIGAFLLLRK